MGFEWLYEIHLGPQTSISIPIRDLVSQTNIKKRLRQNNVVKGTFHDIKFLNIHIFISLFNNNNFILHFLNINGFF